MGGWDEKLGVGDGAGAGAAFAADEGLLYVYPIRMCLLLVSPLLNKMVLLSNTFMY